MEGAINPETDFALLDQSSLDPGQPQSNGKHVSFADAVRREKIEKAALLELRLGRERGELIERKRVQETAAKVGTQVQVGLEAIPSKMAPALAGMSSPREIAQLLQREIKSILSDLSREIANNDF